MNRTLTRRLAFVEQHDVLIAIDLGKHRNVALRLTRQGRCLGEHHFAHNRPAYAALLTWASAIRV